MRRDDVRGRIPAPELRSDGTLRSAVAEREEQRDGYGVRLEAGQCVELQRHELAVGSDPSADPDAALEWYERRRVLGARLVEVGTCLAAEVEDVLEAFVRHEGSSSAATLEQRVRRDGRPVREPLDRLGAHCCCRSDHRLVLLRRCRHLRNSDFAVVDQDGIRKGPTDVDAQRAHAGIRP